MRDTFADLIRSHLPVAPVPSVPELRLHLAGPHSGLGRLLAHRPAPGPPYWAHVWSGGLVLARYLLDHPEVVAGRHVVDLGCGSGLVAIAAVRCGAGACLGVAVDPHAIAAARLNAALNGVAVALTQADILDGPAPETDLVLAGDLFYEAALARRAATFFDRCVAAGVQVIVGDPGRAPLPQARLETIHVGGTPDFGVGQGGVPSVVYRYTGKWRAGLMDAFPRPA